MLNIERGAYSNALADLAVLQQGVDTDMRELLRFEFSVRFANDLAQIKILRLPQMGGKLKRRD